MHYFVRRALGACSILRILIGSALAVHLLISCSLLEDQWSGELNPGIVVRENGLIESVFIQDDTSIHYFARNIRGSDIKKLVVVVRLYSDRKIHNSETLLTTKWITTSVNQESETEPVFLLGNYAALNRNTIEVFIIQVDEFGVLGELPGEYAGRYTLKDVAKDESVTYIMNGFIDYAGRFTFEAQHSSEIFSFINGTMDTNLSYEANFMKDDRSIVSNAGGAYSAASGELSITDQKLNDEFEVTVQLKKVIK